MRTSLISLKHHSLSIAIIGLTLASFAPFTLRLIAGGSAHASKILNESFYISIALFISFLILAKNYKEPEKENNKSYIYVLLLSLAYLASKIAGHWVGDFSAYNPIYFIRSLSNELLIIPLLYLATRKRSTEEMNSFLFWTSATCLVLVVPPLVTGAFLTESFGTLTNPNHTANLIAITSPFALALIQTKVQQAKLRRTLASIFIISSFLALFLLGGRASLMAWMISTAFFFVLTNPRSRYPISLLSLLAIALAAVYWDVVTLLYHSFANSASWSSREAIYLGSIDAISQSPILGHGAGASYYVNETYAQTQPYFLNRTGQASVFGNTHNEYLETLLDGGIIALVLFMSIFALPPIVALIKHRKTDKPQWLLISSLSTSQLAFFISGILTVSTREITSRFMFFLVGGLILNQLFEHKNEKSTQG